MCVISPRDAFNIPKTIPGLTSVNGNHDALAAGSIIIFRYFRQRRQKSNRIAVGDFIQRAMNLAREINFCQSMAAFILEFVSHELFPEICLFLLCYVCFVYFAFNRDRGKISSCGGILRFRLFFGYIICNLFLWIMSKIDSLHKEGCSIKHIFHYIYVLR